MVRSSTSLTPNQKHHAFFFSGEGAFFSRTETYGIRIWPSKKKKKKNSCSLFQGSFHSVKKGMRKTKKRGTCERSSLTYAVSLPAFFAYLCCLLSLLFFLFFFFPPLTKEKEEEKKKREKSNRCAAGCICVRVLGFCILQNSFFFFFHFSAQLTNFGGQKT